MAEPKRYIVLCWGACETQGHPCGLEYYGRRYETGAIVDDFPPAAVRAEIDAGHIAPYEGDEPTSAPVEGGQ